ncbi:MAG: AAA family ATPase, partial [Myxococcota bacterium]
STAPERLEAGLVHTLGTLADDDGPVHVPRLELIERAGELLGVDVRLLVPALDALERSELVICESLGDRGECVSLAPMWRAESESAAAMIELLTTPMRPLPIDLDRALEAFEERVGLRLAAAQRRAVRAAIADKCVVITGGPGVGKTTIVRAIIDILSAAEHSDGDDAERRVVLAAPTGRAAKRLSESTDRDAVTIHRLLEFQPQHGHFARDESQPLDADVVIIDEVSMVDIALLRALLAATPRPAQLILVGDIDQLPSVGPGAVLADIIASEAATVVRLTEIFRQAAQSRIITAAHQINQGVVPELAPPPGRDAHRSDFYFIPRDDPDTARQTIITLVAERIPESFGYAAPDDIQVLSPIHRGELGTRALNDALQARLNPGGTGVPELTRGDRAFRAGDKVMQVRNDYDRAVFNGDIGHITDVIMSKGDSASLLVEFPGDRVCRYQRDDLDQIIHAYAVSVHKSQGSEYPVVILPLVTQHFIMLRRNLLYTAITRGKKLVVVVGSRRAVALATRNHQTGMRWTWLAERIRAGVSGAL